MAEEDVTQQKRERTSEGDGAGGIPAWICTYTDLITLMLAFFVILISFGTFEKGRIVKFVGAFKGAFKILPGGFKTDPGEQVIDPGKEILRTFRAGGGIVTKLQGICEQQGVKRGVEFKTTNTGFEVTLADYSMFGLQSGSADILSGMKPFLDELAETIRQSSYLVRIEGHTDNVPVKSQRFASNWELSTTRAVTILRYFLEEGGISPLRLSAAGFGAYRPLAPNDTEEQRAKNRRVMIYLQRNELKEGKVGEEPLFKEGVVKTL
jgi:chemotaxis protein MotB